jgi:iron(III) transport system substrate-binding protein
VPPSEAFLYAERRSIYLPARAVDHRIGGCSSLSPRSLAGLLASAALAQAPARNDEAFRYRGADREARLAERARSEGSVVLYTSLAPTESKPLADAFEKKYGVKVELWRALSDKVVQRVITEAQGKRHAWTWWRPTAPRWRCWRARSCWRRSTRPTPRTFRRRDSAASRVAARPHELLRRGLQHQQGAALGDPATYEGFTNPKWAGRIGIEATDAEWMATLVKAWGEQKGMDFFRRLAAMKPDVRKGHVLLAELVAAGEVPVALTLYNSNVVSLKRKGAPIDLSPVQPWPAARRASARRATPRTPMPRRSSSTSSSRPRDNACSNRSGACPRARG